MLPDDYTLPRNAVRCEPPLQGPGSTSDFDEFVSVTWTNPASRPDWNFRPVSPREVVRELMRYERQRRARRLRFLALVLFTIAAVAVAVLGIRICCARPSCFLKPGGSHGIFP